MAADIAAIKTAIDIHLAGENGLNGRVRKLEDADKRQWWITYVVTPAIIAAGHIARAFGSKV